MASPTRMNWRLIGSILIAMVMLMEYIHGSRVGQLSSYDRVVFRDGSGLALSQMVVSNESGTYFVYIGGISTLYQLDTDLTPLRQDSTVPDPCDPSDSTCVPCEDPCLYETKILEIAPLPVGKLIQCGGHEGKCELRNWMNISREFGYTSHEVVNDGASVGIVAMRQFETPELFMYTATSHSRENPNLVSEPITQRELKAVNPSIVFGFGRSIPEANVVSAVDYIQGVSWKNYNFVIVHSGSMNSKLGRLCSDNNEDDLDAYSEIMLSCEGYNSLESIHIDLDDVLYGVFTNGTHSALCSYTLSDIQRSFVDATCGCAIGQVSNCAGTGISYLLSVCPKTVSRKCDLFFFCPIFYGYSCAVDSAQ